MDLGLRDRVCLVTGSTSGIGLETVRLLVAEGAQVVVTGRRDDRVETARSDAGAALGLAADLSEPSAPEALVARTSEALGPIDCLVTNAEEASPTSRPGAL